MLFYVPKVHLFSLLFGMYYFTVSYLFNLLSKKFGFPQVSIIATALTNNVKLQILKVIKIFLSIKTYLFSVAFNSFTFKFPLSMPPVITLELDIFEDLAQYHCLLTGDYIHFDY